MAILLWGYNKVHKTVCEINVTCRDWVITTHQAAWSAIPQRTTVRQTAGSARQPCTPQAARSGNYPATVPSGNHPVAACTGLTPISTRTSRASLSLVLTRRMILFAVKCISIFRRPGRSWRGNWNTRGWWGSDRRKRQRWRGRGR